MRNPFTIRNRMILAVIAVALSSVVATSQSTNNPSNGGLTVGTSAITGGTDTRILRNNAGVLGEYTISGTGTAVCMTISCVMTTPSLGVASAAALNLSGNISTTAWTTSGIRYTSTTATLTDTSSSGTVAAARTNSFGGETVAASSATTYTNYYGSYFVAPVAGTNVTLTNKPALGADSIQVAAGTTAAPSLIFGTGTTDGFYSPGPGQVAWVTGTAPKFNYVSSQFRVSSDATIRFGSATDVTSGSQDTSVSRNAAGVVQFGTGAANASGSTLMTGLTATGSSVNFSGLTSTSTAQTGTICWTTGTGNLTVDTTTTCLLSSARFKHDIHPLRNALATTLALKPVSYEYNDMIKGEQVGFVAEDVAEIDGRLVSRENDGTPRAVRYQQLTAVLAGAIQQLKSENDNLRIRLDRLENK